MADLSTASSLTAEDMALLAEARQQLEQAQHTFNFVTGHLVRKYAIPATGTLNAADGSIIRPPHPPAQGD